MNWILLLEQGLNGLQFGLMLFLLASGLTLVFGIMDMINLAHGALYMVGAFLAAWLVQLTQSFVIGLLLAIVRALMRYVQSTPGGAMQVQQLKRAWLGWGRQSR